MGGSESVGVVWAGGVVCVMVLLQRVDERRLLSARPSRQARSLLVLTSHLTDSSSSSQPATSGKQAPHRRSANLLRYAKSPGKTPAVPWYYKLPLPQLSYSTATTKPRTMDLCLASLKGFRLDTRL